MKKHYETLDEAMIRLNKLANDSSTSQTELYEEICTLRLRSSYLLALESAIDVNTDLGKRFANKKVIEDRQFNFNSVFSMQFAVLGEQHIRDPEKAIGYYTKAINLDEKNPIFYSGRAKCHEAKGDNAKALADYKKAVDLDNKNEEFLLDYQRMQNVKSNQKPEYLFFFSKSVIIENYLGNEEHKAERNNKVVDEFFEIKNDLTHESIFNSDNKILLKHMEYDEINDCIYGKFANSSDAKAAYEQLSEANKQFMSLDNDRVCIQSYKDGVGGVKLINNTVAIRFASTNINDIQETVNLLNIKMGVNKNLQNDPTIYSNMNSFVVINKKSILGKVLEKIDSKETEKTKKIKPTVLLTEEQEEIIDTDVEREFETIEIEPNMIKLCELNFKYNQQKNLYDKKGMLEELWLKLCKEATTEAISQCNQLPDSKKRKFLEEVMELDVIRYPNVLSSLSANFFKEDYAYLALERMLKTIPDENDETELSTFTRK